MSWECCLVLSRWSYNELLIFFDSLWRQATSLFFPPICFRVSGTFLLFCSFGPFHCWYLYFLHLSLSLSVSVSFTVFFRWMRPGGTLWEGAEQNRCRLCLKEVCTPWIGEHDNRKKLQKTYFHSDIDPATQFLLFLASPFENGHESFETWKN